MHKVNRLFDIVNLLMSLMNVAMIIILYLEYFLFSEYNKKQYYSAKLIHPYAFEFLTFSIIFHFLLGLESGIKLLLMSK